MGSILSSRLKDVLSQYTYNFDKQQISIQLLKGQFSLENLIVNEQKINEILKAQQLPVRLKFGLLKKFLLKLSILEAKLENMTVDDLVLIFGPATEEPEKFEGAEELELYNLALRNLAASQNGGQGAKYLDRELFAEVERLRLEKLLKARQEQEKKALEAAERARARAKAKEDSKETVNLMGIELFELIKNFLDCSVTIQNIYVVYEDTLPEVISYDSLEQLIVMLSFSKFAFGNRDITRDTDKDGIFKNFMNVGQFLRKSGTWSLSDTAYWNLTFESFQLSLQTGNPLFITQVELNKMVDLSNAPVVLAKFYETKDLNKARSSYRLLALDRISLDLVLFYKETSLIPVHAAFLLFDLGRVELNLEAYKVSTFFDILSYFQTKTAARSFDIIKPKFRPLTPQRFEAVAARLRLSADQRTLLAGLRKIIAREYYQQMLHLLHYQSVVASGVDPEVARLMILNQYCHTSRLYRLLFGPRIPDSLKLRAGHFTQLRGHTKPTKVTPDEPKPFPPSKGVESLNDSQAIKILNKVHVHLRLQTRVQLNLYRLGSPSVENALVLDSATVDLFKPVGHLKGKFAVSLNRIYLDFNKRLFAGPAKPKQAIFDNLGKSQLDRSVVAPGQDVLFELRSTSMAVEVNLQESVDKKTIYLVYVDLKAGLLAFNYHPEVFRSLLVNLLMFSKLQEKSFHAAAVREGRKRAVQVVRAHENQSDRAVLINPSLIGSELSSRQDRRCQHRGPGQVPVQRRLFRRAVDRGGFTSE